MQSLPGCPAKPHVLSLKKERRMLNSVGQIIYCANQNGKNSEGSEILCHLTDKFTWNSSMDTGKGMRIRGRDRDVLLVAQQGAWASSYLH